MESVCRDTFGYFNASIFKLWTCSLCFSYLFQDSAHLTPNRNKSYPLLISKYNDLGLIPDVSNNKATLEVCKYLDGTNCERWKSCCRSAVECCKSQVSERQLKHKTLSTLQCPKTWDGFGCVSEANAGSIADIRCPNFVQYGFSSDYGTKKCTKNGTWWRDPVSNREWTDYTPCLNLRIYKTMVYVGVICCSISLILLIPAALTFVCLRQLRTQNRIRLHLCLFLSFILTCVTTLMWDIFIYNDRLDNPASKTRMQQNTIICRVLYTLNRYANSSNYFWMFCEGYYLHKLVLHAFKVPTNLVWYYIVGWGGALTPVITYLIIRLQIADKECWVKNIGIYEWIIYIPNLLCILMNMVFLCSILKILLTGLQNHPNEPSNFRRGIKATFLLVPLFGIQLFFIIYRPPEETAYRFPYEVISKFIIDSQGTIVSLVFCYMNSEVHSSLKNCWHGTELPCTRGNQRDFVHNFSASHISLTNIRSHIQMNGYNKAFKPKKAIKIDDKTHEYVFA